MKKKILLSPLIIMIFIVLAGISLAGAAILLGGGGNSEDVNLQKGLVGWWDMNGNAKDKTPNQNDGTVTAATLINDRKGESQRAYNFTGGTDKITVPNSSSLNIIGNQITISGWINWQGNAGGGGGNGRFVDRENGGGYMIFINDTRKISYRWTANVTFSHTSTATIANQGWSFITFTYDGANTRIYINGVLDSTFAETTTFGSISQSLIIGNLSDNTRALDGYLDDIRIYNRPLSQTEITALYEEYNPGIQVSDLQKGLVGWWKMDGNAKDSTPNGNDGTVTGAVLNNDRKGQAQKAYLFNGVGDIITVGSTSSLQPAASLTLSAWVLPEDTGTGRIINKKIGGGTPQGYVLELLSDLTPRLRASDGSGDHTVTSSTALVQDVWSHVVVTFNGTTELIYVNNVLKGTTVGAFAIAYGAQPFYIGGLASFEFFHGAIDDVRVYNRALSAAEITALYEEYDSKIQVSNLQKGLVGNWSFDNGNAKDMTPNENKGVVNGATLTTDRKGQVNKAYNFGTSKYITVSDSTILHVSSAMTVSAWVNGTDDNTERTVVKRDGSFFIRINPNGESPRVSCFTINLGVAENRVSASFTSGIWTHYVCTYDASGGSNNLKLYKDGVFVSQATKTGNVDITTNPIGIGARSNGSNPWIGTVDDVRLYNRVLSAAEVLALYENY